MGEALRRPTLALDAFPMNRDGRGYRSAKEVVEAVTARLREAAASGADLYGLPEHWGESWLAFAPPGLPETDELAWMAEQARSILPPLREEAAKLGLAFLAGTVPAPVGDGHLNRAHLWLPDGRESIQDKLTLTPDEQDPAAWEFERGETLRVVEWRGLRLAVLICLDVEQPALGVALQGLDLDLVLVPSMTGKPSGYARVFGCAKARAIEAMTAVAAWGCVGDSPLDPPRTNHSSAAVFLPCEMELGGFTGGQGVFAEAPAGGTIDRAGVLIAQDVPLDAVRAARRGAAEVWPGPWDAKGVSVEEA